MSTQEQRAEWRELAAAATPGEWYKRDEGVWLKNELQYVYNAIVTTDEADIAALGAEDSCHADAAFIAAARAAVPALLADVDALTQERDALAAELERVRGELATGKPQPTQRENDDAAARIKRIDELYERYGLGGCFGVSEWPEYAQSEFERLDTAQREYEAKYC